MAQCQLDDLDRRAVLALDEDFTISADGEVAKVTGEMTAKIIRITDDRLQLTITFPSGEDFVVMLGRPQTLQELGVTLTESHSIQRK